MYIDTFLSIQQQKKTKKNLYVVLLAHCREDEVTATCTSSYFFINTQHKKKQLTLVDVQEGDLKVILP